jgi:hypothetical protein
MKKIMNQDSFIFKNQLITAFFCSLLAITTSIISAPHQDTPPVFELPNFPSLDKKCKLVIVIPAYNEEKRLPVMIDKTVNYFIQK